MNDQNMSFFKKGTIITIIIVIVCIIIGFFGWQAYLKNQSGQTDSTSVPLTNEEIQAILSKPDPNNSAATPMDVKTKNQILNKSDSNEKQPPLSDEEKAAILNAQ